MSHESPVARQLVAVLRQGERLIEGLDTELYLRSPAPLAASTVGAHMRHVLDVAASFLRGLPEGRIDYDRRERDPEVELDKREGARRLRQVARAIADLGPLRPDEPLLVRCDVPEGVAPDAGWSRSTTGRELTYVLSHAIHHYALIALILASYGHEVEEGFGVAPSTLAYWKEIGRCAPLVG
jgi:uncharacterized damage-inducible protein DinB